jgi:hypothetical protein
MRKSGEDKRTLQANLPKASSYHKKRFFIGWRSEGSGFRVQAERELSPTLLNPEP